MGEESEPRRPVVDKNEGASIDHSASSRSRGEAAGIVGRTSARMPSSPKSSFWHASETLRLILDKLVLGAFLALMAHFLNRNIEEVRNSNSKLLEDQKRASALVLEQNRELLAIRHDVKSEARTLLERRISEFFFPIHFRMVLDGAAWERIFKEKRSKYHRIGDEAERRFLLPNHRAVLAIINDKSSLAGNDPELLHAIGKYVRHVAVYEGLRASGNTSKDPADLDEPFPMEFPRMIEDRLLKYTAEYDKLVQEQIGQVHAASTPQ